MIKKYIQSLHPEATVTQVETKQLYILEFPNGAGLVYSYSTVIALREVGSEVWIITPAKFSISTSRHKNKIKDLKQTLDNVSEEDYASLVKTVANSIILDK